MRIATRGDGLRLELSGAEIPCLRIAGALSGVVVLAAAARNGVGSGRLQSIANALSWQAPGSAAPGPAVACVDGQYLLEDGEDASKWIRVQVYTAYLPSSGQSRIYLEDAYNAMGPHDVAAGDALSGIVDTLALQLVNVSGNAIYGVKMWIDPLGAAGLSISLDGTNYWAPSSAVDVHVLAWVSIGVGAGVNVWLRRTVGAVAESAAEVLNLLQWSWVGF